MSRCFPYPPPGYVCNRATGDALIDSIKIEKEKERIKQEKKEQKRREKELKKKDKKDKKKKENERRKSSDQITDGNRKRKRVSDGFENSVEKINFVNSKQDNLQKEIEAEQLERSSLTEEYGQPIVTESLCYSSDGTQSQTKKCKVEQSPTNGNITPQAGKVIRFRLKKREPESSTHPADETPSTSGRTEDSVPKVVKGLSVKDAEVVIPRPNEQLSFNVLPSVGQDCNTLLTNSMTPKKASKPKSAYESLFSGWVPPPIHFAATEIVNDDDENWLFHSKKKVSGDGASLNGYDGLSGRQSMSLQPRAHLLPELDLYALPYTVPF